MTFDKLATYRYLSDLTWRGGGVDQNGRQGHLEGRHKVSDGFQA